jgi:hypothetical protein
MMTGQKPEYYSFTPFLALSRVEGVSQPTELASGKNTTTISEDFFYYYWWGGTKSLGTANTSGLLYKPR